MNAQTDACIRCWGHALSSFTVTLSVCKDKNNTVSPAFLCNHRIDAVWAAVTTTGSLYLISTYAWVLASITLLFPKNNIYQCVWGGSCLRADEKLSRITERVHHDTPQAAAWNHLTVKLTDTFRQLCINVNEDHCTSLMPFKYCINNSRIASYWSLQAVLRRFCLIDTTTKNTNNDRSTKHI